MLETIRAVRQTEQHWSFREGCPSSGGDDALCGYVVGLF